MTLRSMRGPSAWPACRNRAQLHWLAFAVTTPDWRTPEGSLPAASGTALQVPSVLRSCAGAVGVGSRHGAAAGGRRPGATRLVTCAHIDCPGHPPDRRHDGFWSHEETRFVNGLFRHFFERNQRFGQGLTAINDERLPGNIPGLIGCEEQYRVSDVFNRP